MKRVITEKKEIPISEIGKIEVSIEIAGKKFRFEPARNDYLIRSVNIKNNRQAYLALLAYGDKLGFRLVDEI